MDGPMQWNGDPVESAVRGLQESVSFVQSIKCKDGSTTLKRDIPINTGPPCNVLDGWIHELALQKASENVTSFKAGSVSCERVGST